MIAIALAMDAFAVAIASGVAIKQLKLRHIVVIAASFGLFQALMPLLGWVGGLKLKGLIGGVDHWVAFGLLSAVGGKMIWEAFKVEAVETRTNPLQVGVLLLLSIAVSIDALAAGISFAMLGLAIMTPILVIGLVTFVISAAGVWIGDRTGHFFEKKIEITGGLLLIAIGLKILVTHLAAG